MAKMLTQMLTYKPLWQLLGVDKRWKDIEPDVSSRYGA